MGAFFLPGILFTLALCLIYTDAKSSNVIDLDVYHESLCPDSRRFFIKQLWSTYQELPNRLNLRLVPYGNAEVTGSMGKWHFKCQHGPDECYGNIAQSCAIELMNNTQKSLEFVVCAFHYKKQVGVIDKCVELEDMRYKIRHCTEGPMGGNLEQQMAKLTEALDPPQTFIPWITVNGKGSEEINDKANKDLLKLLCETFQDDMPPVCAKYKRTMRDFYRRLVGL